MYIAIVILLMVFATLPLFLWHKTRRIAWPTSSLFCLKIYLFKDLINGIKTVCHDTYQLQFYTNIGKHWQDHDILLGWNPFLAGGQPLSLMSNFIFWVPIKILSKLTSLLSLEHDPFLFANLVYIFSFFQFCAGTIFLLQILYNKNSISLIGGATLLFGGFFTENMYQPTSLQILFFLPYLMFFLVHSFKTGSWLGLFFLFLFLGATLNHYNPMYFALFSIIFLGTLAFHFRKLFWWIKKLFTPNPYPYLLCFILFFSTIGPASYSFFEMKDYVSPTRGYTVRGAVSSTDPGFQPGVSATLKNYTILFDKDFVPSEVNQPGHHGFYIGILPFLLIGFTPLLFWKNIFARGLIITGAGLSIIGAGIHTPVWGWIVDTLPFVNLIRHPAFLSQWVTFIFIIVSMGGLNLFLNLNLAPLYRYMAVAIAAIFTQIISGSVEPGSLPWLWMGLFLLGLLTFVMQKWKTTFPTKIMLGVLILFHIADIGNYSMSKSDSLCSLPNYRFADMTYPTKWSSECLYCKSKAPVDLWPIVNQEIIWSNPNDDHMLFMQKDFASFFLDYVRPFGYFFGNTFHLVSNSDSWKTFPEKFKLNGPVSKYYLDPEKKDVHIPVHEMHQGLDLTVEGEVTPLFSNNPNRITVRTKADKPMFLLRLENYHKGWKAHIDKKEIPIIRVAPNFQMVPVPAGAHEITFEFHSPYALLTDISIMATSLGWFLMMYWLKKGARGRWNIPGEFKQTIHFRLYSATALSVSMLIIWLPLPVSPQPAAPQSRVDRVPWQASGHLKNFPAQNAFDGNPDSFWHSPEPNNTYGHLIRYFESPKIIKGAFITIRPDMSSQAPSSFLVLGSENGLTWKKLAVKNNIIWSEKIQLFTFTGLDKPYRFYKFDFHESVGGNFVSIAELRLLEDNPEKNIIQSGILKEVSFPNNINRIAVMTVYSSGHLNSFPVEKAFDNDQNTFWHSPEPVGKLGWIAGQLQVPTKVTHINLTIRKDMFAQAPMAFTVSGSLDGTNWQTIGITSHLQWTPGESKTFKIQNLKKAYSYYKINVGSTLDNAFTSMVEVSFWSQPL